MSKENDFASKYEEFDGFFPNKSFGAFVVLFCLAKWQFFVKKNHWAKINMLCIIIFKHLVIYNNTST